MKVLTILKEIVEAVVSGFYISPELEEVIKTLQECFKPKNIIMIIPVIAMVIAVYLVITQLIEIIRIQGL